MSIIEKMSKIVNDGDTAAADQLIHDDYQFLMHSSGKNPIGKPIYDECVNKMHVWECTKMEI